MSVREPSGGRAAEIGEARLRDADDRTRVQYHRRRALPCPNDDGIERFVLASLFALSQRQQLETVTELRRFIEPDDWRSDGRLAIWCYVTERHDRDECTDFNACRESLADDHFEEHRAIAASDQSTSSTSILKAARRVRALAVARRRRADILDESRALEVGDPDALRALDVGAWGQLRPLHTVQTPTDLDPAILPDLIRPWLNGEAEHLQSPLDTVLAPALSGIGAIVGRRRSIRMASGHSVYPCVWSGLNMAPGERKTSILRAGLAPVMAISRLLWNQHQAIEADAKTDTRILRKRMEALDRKIAKASREQLKDLRDDMKSLTDELALAELRMQPERLDFQNATEASIVQLVRRSPLGLIRCEDELSSWFASMEAGLASHMADRGFYLAAEDGDGTYVVDRASRESTRISGLFITVTGGIQPDVLRKHVRAAGSGERADGLLQRIKLLVNRPRDLAIKRLINDDSDPEPLRRVERRTLTIFQWRPIPQPLRFEPEAYRLFNERQQGCEFERKETGNQCYAFASLLAKWPRLIAQLALICEILDRDDDAAGIAVSTAATTRAIAIADHYLSHQRGLYREHLYPRVAAAKELAARIASGTLSNETTVRDLGRASRKFDDRELRAGLLELERCNWLRVENRHSSRGGPASPTILLHPAMRHDRGLADTLSGEDT